MSTVAEIKARLAAGPTPFVTVAGAAQLALVKTRPEGALPVAYVLTSRDASGDNQRATGPVAQRTERDIMVVIVAEDLGDHRGGDVDDVLEDLKIFVRGRLVGWVPPSMDEPVTHVSGEIVEATNGCVWFEDTFSAPTYLRQSNNHEPEADNGQEP